MRLVEGRTFIPSDKTPSTPPVILNETAAKKFFPGQSAVGKHIKMVMAKEWAEIVGVVGSVRDNGLDDKRRQKYIFQAILPPQPESQSALPGTRRPWRRCCAARFWP